MNELQKGMRTEKEHANVVNFIEGFYKKYGRFPAKQEIYKRIALGHLKEDPKYYTKLKKFKL